ncbi:Transient receptor potential cation channel subfamily V member 4, partial [Paramuricea clavata]
LWRVSLQFTGSSHDAFIIDDLSETALMLLSSIIMTVLSQEFKVYLKDPYNYFDWLGLILTLLVIPLRFADVSAQWSVASLGYLFNFLRIFKFSCVTRTTGLYTKTLAKIIYRDISRFLVVFVIVCLGFCGAMFMALTATGMEDIFSNYGTLMLAAVRVLAEQQPVEEDYAKFKPFFFVASQFPNLDPQRNGRLQAKIISQFQKAFKNLKQDARLHRKFKIPFPKSAMEHVPLHSPRVQWNKTLFWYYIKQIMNVSSCNVMIFPSGNIITSETLSLFVVDNDGLKMQNFQRNL